jgi:menaquinone-dependent protoporphyrinogen oxidase
MRVLIAVASKHGSTRQIGEVIAAELCAADITVDLENAEDVKTVAPYDAVILGSAVYEGQWLPEARRLGERHQDALRRVPVWVFSSGPLGAPDPLFHEDPHLLAAPLGEVVPREHQIFAGKLDPSTLNFMEHMIATMVNAPDGDFRSWETIRAWAREIASALHAMNTPAA